jgi:hypothetical protein
LEPVAQKALMAAAPEALAELRILSVQEQFAVLAVMADQRVLLEPAAVLQETVAAPAATVEI